MPLVNLSIRSLNCLQQIIKQKINSSGSIKNRQFSIDLKETIYI
jgi:hypothetical protein